MSRLVNTVELAFSACFPENNTEPEYGRLFHASVFRRRDLALTGRYGPFGIGLDTKAAIVAAHLNDPPVAARPGWADDALSLAQTIYEEKGRLLHKKPWLNCFQWEPKSQGNPGGFQQIVLDTKGHIAVNEKPLRKVFDKFCKNRPSFVTAPHTYPLDTQGQLSTQAVDWLSYGFLDPGIQDWLELEAANVVYRQRETEAQFNYASFPSLRSLAPEVFAGTAPAAPVLKSVVDHVFLVFRWPELQNDSLICTLFAEYLLHKRYEPGENPWFAPELEPVFSPLRVVGIGVMEEDEKRETDDGAAEEADDDTAEIEEIIAKYVLPLYSNQYRAEAAAWAYFLERESPETIMSLVAETLKSYRLLERADAYQQRICAVIGDVEEGYVMNLFYWSFLFGTFKPFMTNRYFPFPFIPNPETSTSDATATEGEDLLRQRPFFRSASIVEIMLETTMAHFDSLSTGFPDAPGSLFGLSKKQGYGWGFVNSLHKTKYSYFTSHNEEEDYYEIRNEVRRRGKDTVVEELPWTNCVSSNGRIGRPIRYYEWMDADACQLAEDVKTAVAHALLAAGHDVTLVAADQIVLHVPADGAEALSREVRCCVEGAITDTLSSAFPSNNSPVDVFNYFARGKVECHNSQIWPVF